MKALRNSVSLRVNLMHIIAICALILCVESMPLVGKGNVLDFHIGFVSCGIKLNCRRANHFQNCKVCQPSVSLYAVPHQQERILYLKNWIGMCTASNTAGSIRATSRRRRSSGTHPADDAQHRKLLNEFSAKAALLLAEAGGKMSASQFRRRWKFTFPDDSLDRFSVSLESCWLGSYR